MALGPGDPLWYYKVLGLHCDGANNSTTFTDVKGKTVTAAGNAKISTTTYPALTGKTSSAYFDGTGDYLTLADSDDWAFGSGNFSIRCFFKQAATGGTYALLAQRTTTTSSYSFSFQITGSTITFICSTSGTATTHTATVAYTQETSNWHFAEVVRSGTSLIVFIDGTAGTPVSISTSALFDSAAVLSIGGDTTGSSNQFNGYLSEIEIYKGVAVNTVGYTPPTAPFPNTYVRVSGTTKDSSGTLASRLVRVYRRDTGAYVGASVADATSGEWVVVAANSGTTTPVKHFAVAHDAPGNPFNGTFLFALRMDDTSLSDETGRTVTIAGDATRSSTQSKFGGYSAYFDGTGDYLSIPAASAIGTGDFTFEAWIYVTTPGSVFIICDNRTSDNDANGFGFYVRSTSKLTFITDGTAYEGTTTVTGTTWHHVSLCRSGTSVRAFLDGNLESTTTKSNNFSRTTWILGHQWSASGTLSSGYIDDAFCLSGAAARTESFTPPSGKFAYILPSATENAQIYDGITPY